MFSFLSARFSFHLKSKDSFCPDFLLKNRIAKGGTMAMWKSELSPFIRVLPTTSPAVLPIFLAIPGLEPSAHIALYLPTQGRDAEFIDALAALETCVLHILEEFACPIFIKGDANTNPNKTSQVDLFSHFCTKFSLNSLDLGHNTHHNFQGEGVSDSQLNVLLYSSPKSQPESLKYVVCSLDNPLVQSHQDVRISSFPLPRCSVNPSSGNITAPRMCNDRVKIKWKDENIDAYKSLVSPSLSSLRERWAGCSGPASACILLAATNETLSLAAQSTNYYSDLTKPFQARLSQHTEIKAAQKFSLAAAQSLRTTCAASPPDPAAVLAAHQQCTEARASLQCLTRALRRKESDTRDKQLHSILDKNPAALFSANRSFKSNTAGEINKLKVASKVYTGKDVPDGFYDSLSTLKSTRQSTPCPHTNNIHL